MPNSPDISALSAYAGTYEQALFSTLVNGMDAANDLTVYPNVKDTIKLTKLTAGGGARPYRPQHDPNEDALAYTGRDLSVKIGKLDLLVEPLKYTNTWMSQAMGAGTNNNDIPFAQYTWEQVMKELAEEINDNTVWAGTHNANGTEAVDIATGLGTLIEAEIEYETLEPVTTGAITNENAVAKFELMMKAMPVAYRNRGFSIYCSYSSFDKYQEDYREKFKKYVEMNEAGQYTLDATSRRVNIVPCSWMGTSSRLVATPKENLLLGTDLLSDFNKINTVQDVWTIKAGIAFKIGFQIRDLAALRVNDQE
jgi:hypothetical protein